MAQKDYKKLIMVTGDNNNKFYEMIWEGGSSFTVKYGRVESTSTTISYPYSQWNKKYNEKVKKGYKDVTGYVSVEIVSDDKGGNSYAKISDNTVQEFIELMRQYRDNLVSTTYSVKAEQVSQRQIEKAQTLIDTLNLWSRPTFNSKTADFNLILTELYTIIPRKMKNVKDHLIPAIKLEDIIEQEQDNLDAMASQVNQNEKKSGKKKKVDEKKTILDELGITVVPCGDEKEIQYLTKQVSKLDSWHKTSIKQVFRVDKPGENKSFEDWLKSQKNKDTRILIHGTKCESVLPILDIGLKIRPKGNFQFSGKVYGDGNYFSETMSKSLNYTGWGTDKVILVYEVHTGKPFVYNGWYKGNSFILDYKNLKEKGFDSTFVKAGGGLLNSEIIAYKEEQCRIKYIIWLK
jgi:poly [ADP-ribose] polymerase